MEPERGGGDEEIMNNLETAIMEELQQVGMELQDKSSVHYNFDHFHFTMVKEGNQKKI